MKNIVIVGGGIAGITAALLLKKKYENVYLIEKESQCGGLLRSNINENGTYFDMGTHIPSETLHKEVDELLFSEMKEENWNYLSYLNTGSFFCGKIYEKSQFIYTPFLEDEVYSKGIVQLLNCTSHINIENYGNLLDYCNDYYGQTFTESIYGPLMKKLLGKSLNELHPSALKVFSFSRLIPGEKDMSKHLKKSPVYDEKLAYATFYEGISPQHKYYPKYRKGVQLWIDELMEKVRSEGIHILNNAYIKEIEFEKKEIKKIKLNNDEEILIEALVWSIAPAILLKMADTKQNCKAPEFRNMTVHNFIFDKPFLNSNHYINCVDSNYKSFRITIYPNINTDGIQTAPYNCTVEALVDQNEDLEVLNLNIIDELKNMGLISEGTKPTYRNFYSISNGFPILTPEVVEGLKEQCNVLNDSFKNVVLIGKASGETFFMNESTIDAYNKIEKFFG